jgi:hypothetical protein
MPRQVSDEEFAFLQGRRQVADFVESIYNDPQLTREAKALIKKKYPNLNIPDYDVEARVEERLTKDREEREREKTEERERADQTSFQNLRKQTQEKYGFTDAAMTDLEKLMVERNVGDYDVAASYMAAQNPQPSEAAFHDGRWNHSKAPGFAEIAKDPEEWGRGEILKALHNDQERAKQQRF